MHFTLISDNVYYYATMSDLSPMTLQELVTLALPAGTRVLTAQESLNRTVSWVVLARCEDAFARCVFGDFVFVLPPYPDDLARLIFHLKEIGAVGVAVFGEPAPTVIAAAEQANMPLLALPPSADVRRIERMAVALLVDRGAGLEQRTAQLYQQLTMLSAENAGLEAMIALIGRTIGKTVLAQDKRLRLLAAWFAPEAAPDRENIESWISAPANLPEELCDRRRAAQVQGALEQPLPAGNLRRLIAPIVVKGMARGFLSIIAPPSTLDPFSALLIERGAAACALEMAKAKAVHEVEKRARGDFVDAILAGNLTRDEAAWWAARIAFPTAGVYATLISGWASAEQSSLPSLRRLETIVSGELRGKNMRAYARAREDAVVIFVALDPEGTIEPAQKLADRINRQAASEFPHARLATGLGRAVRDLLALRESYREAQQARSIAARLAESNPLYFGDLSVYRLLLQLEDSPELASFCREILGPLIEYDRAQKANLLDTLFAYFAHHANVSRTAAALYIHRNTLLYRMARIAEISGWDLQDPESRFAVQLALRAHRLLQANSTGDAAP
jgi:purine catabolism regulator